MGRRKKIHHSWTPWMGTYSDACRLADIIIHPHRSFSLRRCSPINVCPLGRLSTTGPSQRKELRTSVFLLFVWKHWSSWFCPSSMDFFVLLFYCSSSAKELFCAYVTQTMGSIPPVFLESVRLYTTRNETHFPRFQNWTWHWFGGQFQRKKTWIKETNWGLGKNNDESFRGVSTLTRCSFKLASHCLRCQGCQVTPQLPSRGNCSFAPWCAA